MGTKNRIFGKAGVALFFSVASLLLAGGSASAGQSNASKPFGDQWSKKMQGLYHALAALLTDVTSDQRFNDPANQSRIQGEAATIAGLSHDIAHDSSRFSSGIDPGVQTIAGMLNEESHRAQRELAVGNRGYARTILRSIPSYCIACHTRNASGPSFATLPLEPSGDLTSAEKGEFYAATRQFARAQAELARVVASSGMAVTQPIVWSRAVYQSLAIAVRVDRSPDEASKLVQAVLDLKLAPLFVQMDAAQWKRSIDRWKRETPRRITSEAGLHAELLRLMRKAHEMQNYPADRSADIEYLRASAVAHDLLQISPQGRFSNEALLMAGACYEVLNPTGLEDLPELYYEACIRRNPHSMISEQCFGRYERNVYLGYTGSAGLELPDDVRKQISELRSLARRQPGVRN